jgi:glycerone phosphate O-acyltransferase/fatty acyl-CoA reductase
MFEEHIMEHYESCSIEIIKNAIIIYMQLSYISIQKINNDDIVTVLLSDEKVLFKNKIFSYLK